MINLQCVMFSVVASAKTRRIQTSSEFRQDLSSWLRRKVWEQWWVTLLSPQPLIPCQLGGDTVTFCPHSFNQEIIFTRIKVGGTSILRSQITTVAINIEEKKKICLLCIMNARTWPESHGSVSAPSLPNVTIFRTSSWDTSSLWLSYMIYHHYFIVIMYPKKWHHRCM